MDNTLVGIDWGTSNRRAYLLHQDGRVLARHEDAQGMLATRGRFAESLDGLLGAMNVSPEVPVVMSGMVGSAQGWQEVPYLDCSIPLSELPAHLHPAQANRFIVPGYRYQDGADGIDVMRGEETQLLGVITLGYRDGWIVLPGTHSKWVLLRDGVIERVATYMTGELFAMLSNSGTLSNLMADDRDDADAFAAGVRQARQLTPLSNALFRVRARVVTGAMPAAQTHSFVSGLLIGTEFAAALESQESITVIGSPALAERYATTAALFEMRCRVLDPHEVYCNALSLFFEHT